MRKIKRAARKKAAAGILIGLTGLLFGPQTALAGEAINYAGDTADLQTIGAFTNAVGTTTSTSDNTVMIDYSSGTTPDFVFGAYNTSDDVNNNIVTIGNGDVGSSVYGGFTNAGSATGNSITIISGNISNSVYGGYSSSGSATDNTVTINGGSIGDFVYGGFTTAGDATDNSVTISDSSIISNSVFGGSTFYGNATGNTVTIRGGTVSSNVFGGYSYSSNATDNTVTISGGAVSDSVYGGFSTSGSATDNTVTVRGSTINGDVYGGWSDSDSATDNTVIISGGTVSDSVFGGVSYSGNATDNTVTISGGTVSGTVYGGWSDSGSATGNTVTISGTPTLGLLYGGYVASGSGDAWTGNTLNVKSSGITVTGDVRNFQYYNFYLPNTLAASDIMLNVSGTTDISNATMGIYLSSDTTLKAGDTVTLIQSGTLLSTGGATITPSYVGIAKIYSFTVATSGSIFSATVSGVSQNSQVKALSEGQVSGAAFLNQGADMLSGQGLQTARSAAAGAAGQISSFAALGGSSLRYETGSHVDVNGISFVAGAAKEKSIGQDKLTNGLFLEHGWGSSSTYNSFSNATSVKGSGDTQYFGAGWLGRRQKHSGQYIEGSIRTGQVSNKFNSSDIGTAGTASSYDVSSPYYGLHIGIGKETDIGKNKKRDVYAKALWTHQNGSSATVQGDSFQFDAVDSLRGQAGVKWSYKTNESTTLHTGLAYQYEFDGNAGATVNGSAVESPSMQGGTGIMEIGLTKENKTGKGPTLDLGLQGFCGKTRGIAGTVQAAWKF